MKIISGNKVWVQRYNISTLLNMLSELDTPVSDSIMSQVFGDPFISADDMFDFVEYDGKELVDFFRGLDFIVDHNDLLGKNAEEVRTMGKRIQEDVVARSSRERDKAAAQRMCHAAVLKMTDMRNYMWYLEGEIRYDMPMFDESGLDPIFMENGRMVVKTEPKPESGIRRILTSIFGKRF